MIYHDTYCTARMIKFEQQVDILKNSNGSNPRKIHFELSPAALQSAWLRWSCMLYQYYITVWSQMFVIFSITRWYRWHPPPEMPTRTRSEPYDYHLSVRALETVLVHSFSLPGWSHLGDKKSSNSSCTSDWILPGSMLDRAGWNSVRISPTSSPWYSNSQACLGVLLRMTKATHTSTLGRNRVGGVGISSHQFTPS